MPTSTAPSDKNTSGYSAYQSNDEQKNEATSDFASGVQGAPDAAAESEAPIAISEGDVLAALLIGDVRERGLLPYSSNHSFLALVRHEDLEIPAVYKPQRGENPLWDFEWGTLCKRETAAYLVSHALGWDLVPPTVLRNASRGLGSVQFYVDHDSDAHYFTFQSDARHADSLRRLALFDAIINNADRKSGHCLVGSEQRLWAIDHGLTFHTEYKLRTVLWEFSGEAIAQPLMDDLDDLRMQLVNKESDLTQQLSLLLTHAEQRAFVRRVQIMLKEGCFPEPLPQRRNYPWPPV